MIPRSIAEWLVAGILVAAIAVVAHLFLNPTTHVIQCDGSVPTWMINSENEGTGCVEILPGPPPASWDGSWICIGLCGDPMPSPYFPSS